MDIFLSKALSFNRYDGRYLLHMYYYSLNLKPQISINPQEHTAFSWVSLQEFETLDLLISQGKAFKIIKNTLFSKINYCFREHLNETSVNQMNLCHFRSEQLNFQAMSKLFFNYLT